LTLWALQSAIFLTKNADAFQSLRPTKPQGMILRMFDSRPTLEDYPISDFQQRLLNRMNSSTGGMRNIKTQNSISKRNVESAFIQEVRTLKDYKRVVIDENHEGQLVVVWFHSPWCRSCKSVSKGFQALSREYQKDIKFVQVPVLSDNATLHQGLGVKSVPFVHVYHPTEGLVEERKLTRKYLPGFHRLLKDYRRGECSLEQLGIGNDTRWSTDSPYEPAPKSMDQEEETFLEE
jgi:thiol-disulfide isomerase/thioredoxin